MRYDVFEFNHNMTKAEKFWRIALLVLIVSVLVMNVFFWGPA